LKQNVIITPNSNEIIVLHIYNGRFFPINGSTTRITLDIINEPNKIAVKDVTFTEKPETEHWEFPIYNFRAEFSLKKFPNIK